MSAASLMAIIRWAGRQAIDNAPAKNVLNAIATYADRAGAAHPSQRELADHTGYSERAVRMALALLEAEGFIRRVERRRGNGSRTSDGLQLILDREAHNRHEVPVVEPAATGTPCQAPRNLVPSSPARDSAPTTFEQPGEQPREHSDPGGSAPPGGAGRTDFQKELFERGTRELRRLTGRSAEKCRSLIGSWRALTGDDATVLAAIDAAGDAEVIEPVGWIEKRLRARRDELAAARRQAGASVQAVSAWLQSHPAVPPPEVAQARAAAALAAARQGQWPTGGIIFVAADSPEGEAWAQHYARFGVRPRWAALGKGMGWNMPSLRPPIVAPP